jgi:NAD-dependent dihydropyrimidine dehydrogenase PreA subunit
VNPLTAPALRVVLYEGSGSSALPEDDRLSILRALLERGFAVSCARSDGKLSGAGSGTLLVLGRFLEKNLPEVTDPTGQVAVQFRDLAGVQAADVPAIVDSFCAERQIPQPGGWKPWFPVIDYSRCTNCMQCLSFCLFDVYGVSTDGKIQVRNQNNCKTDCPACSRVCPEVAILFPKYRHGPIHGGEINPEDLSREAMKVDISALLGGDIYKMLRDRSARAHSRFSKERDEERALKERQRCLSKLAEQMDIPPEVLATLPSAEEIRARAEAAMTRAREHLKEPPGPVGE